MICFKSKCSERPCTVVIDFLSFRCRIRMWMLLLLFGRAFDSAVRRHRVAAKSSASESAKASARKPAVEAQCKAIKGGFPLATSTSDVLSARLFGRIVKFGTESDSEGEHRRSGG